MKNTKTQLNTIDNRTLLNGIVYKKSTGSYTVQSNERFFTCTVSSKLRKEMTYTSNGRVKSVRELNQDPITVGDEVRFTIPTMGETGIILDVLPRRNWLSRPSSVPMPGAKPFEQIIVANVSQVIPVFSAANPAPKWNLLDRYLVSAESSGIPAMICITKVDLPQANDSDLLEVAAEYRRIGYPVILTSAETGQGLDELKHALTGRTSVLLGKSGVGKTSLLNALQPGLGQRVGAVSQMTGKGKHTTTHLEMFPLESGGAVVDTPGVREFGLWNIGEDELAEYFPEMRPHLGRCKFGLDCSHDEEPGCAVRKAVAAGQISPHRYFSYMHLREEP